ncbi:hypothetical protein P3G55_19005 [Leptospira sp. 96542]|nr:hypothetical protein [Leptospira sp. 96542]
MADSRENLTKQVFVAYAYNLYDQRDYRKVYASLEKSFGVKFIFADEKITNMHILQKIISYIRGSDFSLFDISAWNPNVTLELGIALATSDDWYICFNPNKTDIKDVPSDIRGLDRIQYESFSELEDRLSVLLDQWYPRSTRTTVADYFESAKKDALALIKQQPGLRVNELADILGMNLRMAQVVVGQLISSDLIRLEGKTRGAKYFPA